ncbi:MAG: outer membrane protein assembly factor BamE [Nitrosomonadales bacterium]|nr:outer membrane protein assembly factor BamE [Nitrosomonadales bacterium]
MFSILRTAAISIIALMLAACSTVQVGRDFDVRSLEMKIERGVTTQNQVRTWLGAPTNTGVNVDTGGERFDEWTYYFASGKLPGMSNAKLKMLQVKFDKQGIVRGYNWSASDQ